MVCDVIVGEGEGDCHLTPSPERLGEYKAYAVGELMDSEWKPASQDGGVIPITGLFKLEGDARHPAGEDLVLPDGDVGVWMAGEIAGRASDFEIVGDDVVFRLSVVAPQFLEEQSIAKRLHSSRVRLVTEEIQE